LQVRSFKKPLVQIIDPRREIVAQEEAAPTAEVFEDPVLRLDASLKKVRQKKADLLQSDETTPGQLRKLDRDLKHLSLARNLLKEVIVTSPI
jgi:hypothetical protein